MCILCTITNRVNYNKFYEIIFEIVITSFILTFTGKKAVVITQKRQGIEIDWIMC